MENVLDQATILIFFSLSCLLSRILFLPRGGGFLIRFFWHFWIYKCMLLLHLRPFSMVIVMETKDPYNKDLRKMGWCFQVTVFFNQCQFFMHCISHKPEVTCQSVNEIVILYVYSRWSGCFEFVHTLGLIVYLMCLLIEFGNFTWAR